MVVPDAATAAGSTGGRLYTDTLWYTRVWSAWLMNADAEYIPKQQQLAASHREEPPFNFYYIKKKK